jgi:hypothetical protein
MEVRSWKPPVAPVTVQVDPSLALTKRAEPTPMQVVGVGQATEPIPPTWGGTVLKVQVAPSFTER